MKRAATLAGLLLLTVGVAAAPASDCALRNLGACQSTNDLFWGAPQKSGRAAPRHELRDALTTFLQGAPKLYLGKTGFTPAQIASGALVGPGDHHDRLSGGNWFFDGFTPHDAQERGAVLFDAGGAIKLVALLNVERDEPGPDPDAQEMNQYRLHIYSHGKAAVADIRLLQNWAGYTTKTDRGRGQTQESLVGTELVTLDGKQWRRAP